jgi:hypothetical protein
LFVEISERSVTLSGVEVLNLLGQEITTEAHNDANRISIDTQRLQPGVYLLELNLNDQRVIKRFIKQ